MDVNQFLDVDSGDNNDASIVPEMETIESDCIQKFDRNNITSA